MEIIAYLSLFIFVVFVVFLLYQSVKWSVLLLFKYLPLVTIVFLFLSYIFINFCLLSCRIFLTFSDLVKRDRLYLTL